jgi:hypothetical protein
MITRRKMYALLAWSLFAIITIFALASVVRDITNRQAGDNWLLILGDLLWGVVPVVFSFLAALIVSRRPRNVIGWLMMIPASFIVIDFIVRSYLGQFPTAPDEPTIPLMLTVYFASTSWVLLVFPLLFTILLFPNGKPPSSRWRWILWLGLGMIAFMILLTLFSPTIALTEIDGWVVTNPIGFLPEEPTFLYIPWAVAMIILTLLCVAAPFVRYRRGTNLERQQIKWLFYACGVFALVYVFGFFATESSIFDIWQVLFLLAIMAIPTSIAIAILRYRLYDIDVIIRRTLVYALLTGLLVLTYFGSVLLLQALFTAVSGQRSAVAIVISTLIIAALFQPLRRRVQALIDRRFFRRKYDATQTLAQFAITARDEVDLDRLTGELVQVVQETMQPEGVTLWLLERDQI